MQQSTKKDPPLPPLKLPLKKLKIKFGPDGNDVTVSEKEEKKVEPVAAADLAKPAEVEDEKPPVEKSVEVKEVVEESKTSVAATSEAAISTAAAVDETTSKTEPSPSSPMKKGSRIDFLASKLGAMKQASPPKQTSATTATTTMPASIHDAIFGPSVPVNMSKSVPESQQGVPESQVESQGKSELERMQEEIDRMNSDPPKESFKDPRKKALKYLKGSADRQQTTTPPMPGDAAGLNSNVSASSAPAPPSMGMKNFKKALLNKFSGGDIYPAVVNNGPSAASVPVPVPLPVPAVPEPTPTVTWRKAVDSVTSVPTRADYQWQLEEHQVGNSIGLRNRPKFAKKIHQNSYLKEHLYSVTLVVWQKVLLS